MKIYKFLTGIMLALLFQGISLASEIPAEWHKEISLKNDLHIEKLNTKNYPDFFYQKKEYFIDDQKVSFPKNNFCSDEEEVLPENTEIKEEIAINLLAIEKYLAEEIAPKWNTEAQNVRIYKDEEGNILFEGAGVLGKTLDVHGSAEIIREAILNDVNFATLNFNVVQPEIKVEDEDLKNMGIKDLISMGESDFSGSPYNRIHNINTGANRFNATLIAKDEIFSFNDILGAVNYGTGYKQELVIKGEQTVPDYGGGLCQVSTTSFRAALLAGLEIVERWPHAYAVSYYAPWGTDATIYIGGKNFKFKNDSEGAILIQTRVEDNKLFFHFYGTADERRIALFGPYTGGWVAAPEARTQYTDELAPGEKKKVSGSHAGFNATWFSFVKKATDTEYVSKKFYSPFQARGYLYLVGKDKPVVVERRPM